MTTARSILLVAALSAAHFAAVFVAFCWAFARSLERFDAGGDPTIVDAILNGVVNVLWFPLLQFAHANGIHNDAAEWILVIANSVLWGLGLYAISLIVANAQLHSRRTQRCR